jgi:hypothetical protein
MNEIIIRLDEKGSVIAVEGIPSGTPVRILRKKPEPPAEPEEPKLAWFGVFWHVLAAKTMVKCFNEAEAKQLASDKADDSAPNGGEGDAIKLEGGRKLKHVWYDPLDEEPYISSVDQDEDTLAEGAEIDKEGA